MALDSTGLPVADPAPSADSPAPADDGTQAGNSPTPPQPVEDNPRVIAAQAALTRKAQEAADLRRENEELRASIAAPDEDEGDEPAPVRQPRGAPSQRELDAIARAAAAEAAVAESIYGTDVVDAYDAWLPMWNGTTTKADEITALLAFADRIRGAAPQAPAVVPAAGGPLPREQALQPRVDQNRSDAPAPSDIDPKQYEGRDDGGRSFFRDQLARLQGRS